MSSSSFADPAQEHGEVEVNLPKGDAAEGAQDEEWCEVQVNGETKRIRFHDYHEIYAIPGLYEHIFYDLLKCTSPRTVCALLEEQLKEKGQTAGELDVLDVGAGNGMVGEELQRLGARSIVGVDIIEEAAEAADRDRPGAYQDYFVLDLTEPEEADRLSERHFNCLVTVAALGFGDIPPEAFAAAYNLVDTGGLIAFNIKEDFISEGDGSGFAGLVRRALAEGTMALDAEQTYRHRLSVAGEPLHYVAIVAEKRGELSL